VRDPDGTMLEIVERAATAAATEPQARVEQPVRSV
jgi:hypothetical protein